MKRVQFEEKPPYKLMAPSKGLDKEFKFAVNSRAWDSIVPYTQQLLKSDNHIWNKNKLNTVAFVLAHQHVPLNVKQCMVSELSPIFKDDDGKVLLKRVCANKCWNIVPSMLEHGVNKNDAILCAVSGVIPPTKFFFLKKQTRSYDRSHLLQYRSPSHNGSSPLYIATKKNDWGLVNLLIDLGADVNVTNDYKRTVLMEALNDDTPPLAPFDVMMRLLTEENINQHEIRYGGTVLHKVVVAERWDVVPVLIKYGADINATDHKDMPPLHYAIHNQPPPDIFKLLISPQNVNRQDWSHREAGFGGHGRATRGATPLHYALLNSMYDLVPILLEQGAQVNIKDDSSMSAYDYSMQKHVPPDTKALVRSKSEEETDRKVQEQQVKRALST